MIIILDIPFLEGKYSIFKELMQGIKISVEILYSVGLEFISWLKEKCLKENGKLLSARDIQQAIDK